MQYSINVSSEPKFKFNDNIDGIVSEQMEESKLSSNESDASSLVTEEDTSGNPLPPEIVQIRKRNKELQKELTNGIMNFKSTSRSILNSSSNSGHHEEEQKKALANSLNNFSKSADYPDLSALSNKEAVTNFLEKILKLQADYEEAKNILQANEEEIYNTEIEHVTLKMNLRKMEEELISMTATRTASNSCGCYLM